MKKEVNDTVAFANSKLEKITADGFPVAFSDVQLRIDDSEGGLAVYSGTEFVSYVNDDTATRAIWAVVDKARAQVKALTGEDVVANGPEAQTETEVFTIEDVMSEVEKVIGVANAKLAEVTEGGFPFSFDEVKMTASNDSAGIYVHSGSTPVVAVARTGSPDLVLDEIRSGVFDMVDATRTSIERRGNLRKEADALKAEGEAMELAAKTIADKGLDPKSVLKDGISLDSAKAIADAARKALLKANRNPFVGTVRNKEFRMSLKEMSRGLVVVADGKECMITRFPKVGNNKTIERMVRFISSDIASLAASRRAYFERVRRDADREERLHELAAQLDAADAALRAVAVM